MNLLQPAQMNRPAIGSAAALHDATAGNFRPRGTALRTGQFLRIRKDRKIPNPFPVKRTALQDLFPLLF